MAGQVNLGSSLGDTLCELAREGGVSKCLEVGTWNGEGSTLCIATGLAETSGVLFSVELDPKFYEEAMAFYSDRDLPVKLINGATLSADEFGDFEEYAAGAQRTIHEAADPGCYRRMYDSELSLARQAHNLYVLQSLVDAEQSFDLVLLDGGEFTTYAEFLVIEPYVTRYLVLDDTNPSGSIKNVRTREDLLGNKAWDVVADHIDDRNGWLVARRRLDS